jgi:hypothetical protein
MTLSQPSPKEFIRAGEAGAFLLQRVAVDFEIRGRGNSAGNGS